MSKLQRSAVEGQSRLRLLPACPKETPAEADPAAGKAVKENSAFPDVSLSSWHSLPPLHPLSLPIWTPLTLMLSELPSFPEDWRVTLVTCSGIQMHISIGLCSLLVDHQQQGYGAPICTKVKVTGHWLLLSCA